MEDQIEVVQTNNLWYSARENEREDVPGSLYSHQAVPGSSCRCR